MTDIDINSTLPSTVKGISNSNSVDTETHFIKDLAADKTHY